MSSSPKSILRCAIYARKSSEEGLDQSFNSLDAQRESCEAFIDSQRHEGWKTIPTHYDDGGYSGGTMDRPSLQRLLQDVHDGRVNVIVVYKVDRLTRSLADFAKIVETLDAKGVSFVSITQQFNTTTSMGRLTLNILLSFAQFEREVTGERIRDKIAASKKKGMWMGGLVPLGFDLDGRKLVPNAKESEVVSKIFSLYLKLGCVSKLAMQLEREKLRSKAWVTRTGAQLGGVAFARGALYALLRNRLYIGEIRHREKWYRGEHKGIVSQGLWEKVHAQMNSNLRARRNRTQGQEASLLTGLIEDIGGNRFTPSFTIKRGRRYRYYISQLAIKRSAAPSSGPTRLPARELEGRITDKLIAFLKSDAEMFDAMIAEGEHPAITKNLFAAAKKLAARIPSLSSNDLRNLRTVFLRRVILKDDAIEIKICRKELRRVLETGNRVDVPNSSGAKEQVDASDLITLAFEVKRKRCGGEVHMVVPPNSAFRKHIPKLR